MELDLDMRIEEYLDGTLGVDESMQLERELALPEVAKAYQEALLIRTLIKSHVVVPEGLEARIGEMLAEGTELISGAPVQEASSARTVLESMAWAWKGPAMALPGPLQAPAGMESAKVGANAMRFMLPPIDALRSQPEAPKKRPKRPLWRRLLRR